MKFAKYVFYAAGIYGLIALLPQYFLEQKNNFDYPPPITHPEYFYGFIGVALAWQIAFLIIGSNPKRYRPLMLAGVVEKFSFAFAVYALYAAGRVAAVMVVLGTLDLLLGFLFAAAFLKTEKE